MNPRIPAALSVVLALVSPAFAARPADVFILAGQSNMEGRAHQKDLPAELRLPQADVLFYHATAWGPLAPGSSTRPTPPDGFGPEISFGRDLAARWSAQRQLALIKHAPGGTSLAVDWRAPDGPQLVAMLAKVRAALAGLESMDHAPTLRAFVWAQGERDANTNADAARYEERLREFIAHVRRELKSPDLPFIIARCTPNSRPPRVGSEVVREAQANVVRATPHCVLIDTDDLQVFEEPAPNGNRVAVHFDAPSLVKLGERLARAAADVNGVPNVKPVLVTRPAGR